MIPPQSVILVLVRIAAWLMLAAIFAVTVVPIGLRPVSGLPVNEERFIAFAVLGSLFGLGYEKSPRLILALIVIAAAGFELAQHLVASRHGQLSDFVFKALGGGLGVAAGQSARRLLGIG